MQKEELFKQLKHVIVSKSFTDHEVTTDKNLKDDLELDSLDKVELLMECEVQFKINIEDEEYEKIETVGDLLDIIYRKLN